MVKETYKVDPCQKEACAIQSCLQAHKFQESACQSVIEAMRKCCERFDDSVCCSGFRKTDKKAKS